MRWAIRSRQRQWSSGRASAAASGSTCVSPAGTGGGEQAHRLVQVAVHEDAQHAALGGPRHVDHPDDVGEPRELGGEAGEGVRRPPEEAPR